MNPKTPSHPIQFIDEWIDILYDNPPPLEKTPACPQGFIWRGDTYTIVESLSEWHNFERRGRMARNMSTEHSLRASTQGSWGVGRFFFRVRVDSGRIFDLYFDRAAESVDKRKGNWFLLSERSTAP